MNRTIPLAICCGALCLPGCVTIDNAGGGALAAAALVRGDGAPAGVARLVRDRSGVVLRIEAAGLTPGLHGLHLHAAGRCDRPDFASAQNHWNPAGRAHGSANPAGAHAGDLPNFRVGADGRGRGEFLVEGAAGAPGLASLFDADGAAVVIHAGPDDLRTDPSGNSGARIACGVLVRG